MPDSLTRPHIGTVDVWVLNLEPGPPENLAAFESQLDRSEQSRAERLRVETARRRFVLTRVALRLLLSRYLHVPVTDLPLGLSEGKPVLTDDAHRLAFNVAHSHWQALLAFGEYGAIGVDVEYRDSQVDCDRIGRRVFSEQEWNEYDGLTGEARRKAFFDAWSRKEAVLKATGLGLRLPPRDAEVSLAPGGHSFVVRSAGRRWHTRGLEFDAAYAGAVAADDAIITVRRNTLSTADLKGML